MLRRLDMAPQEGEERHPVGAQDRQGVGVWVDKPGQRQSHRSVVTKEAVERAPCSQVRPEQRHHEETGELPALESRQAAHHKWPHNSIHCGCPQTSLQAAVVKALGQQPVGLRRNVVSSSLRRACLFGVRERRSQTRTLPCVTQLGSLEHMERVG